MAYRRKIILDTHFRKVPCSSGLTIILFALVYMLQKQIPRRFFSCSVASFILVNVYENKKYLGDMELPFLFQRMCVAFALSMRAPLVYVRDVSCGVCL